jgi:hypothetical protein
MKLATRTNATVNTAAGAKLAITALQATPITAGNAHRRITPGITAPFDRCVRYERMVVGTTIAIEVPRQSCMRTSSGTPSTRKTS